MKYTTFFLDGYHGYVYADGFIIWATIGCHIESLADCPLRDAVISALNIG
jgi:hypothetical protein